MLGSLPLLAALAITGLQQCAAYQLTGLELQQLRVQNVSPPIDGHTALIIVDVQTDFLPGGRLGVDNGGEVIPPLMRLAATVKAKRGLVVATQDWHPKGHVSFITKGGLWPVHCVQNSEGAKLAPEVQNLFISDDNWIIKKGNKVEMDAYSAFSDNDGTDTGLADRLRCNGITRLIIGGLATDYCVKQTALDALKNDFEVYLTIGGSRGVNVKEGDVLAALKEVQSNRGTLIS